LFSDAVISTGSSATVEIPWDTAIIDDGGYWDSGDPTKLTISQDGWYTVWACVDVTSSGTTLCRASFIGMSSGKDGIMDVPLPGGINTMAVTYYMTVGTFGSVELSINANGTLSVEDSAADSTLTTQFGITKI
jgi:hypothetical protein